MQKLKMVGISSILNLGKKILLIWIFILKYDENVIIIAMIDANAYFIASKLKKAQVFAVFIKDLKFQVAKKLKLKIDLKNVIQ